VEIRHAWYIEHRSPLGSASEFELINAMTPTKSADPELPSTSWADYDVPNRLPEHLQTRVLPLTDLMATVYAAAGA
jgi:hypothetical protein